MTRRINAETKNPLLDFDTKKTVVVGMCEECSQPVSTVATYREMNGRTLPMKNIAHPWCRSRR